MISALTRWFASLTNRNNGMLEFWNIGHAVKL
jgi:hypothetical protein